MREIADLLGSGAVAVTVDRVFPLSGIAEAHRVGERRRTAGEPVVRVAG